MEERVVKWSQKPGGPLELVPGYISSYSVSADSREFTFTLLKGLKWSDGEPVTTEDVRFWYEDVFMNKDLLASIDQTLAPGGKPMQLEIVDEQTFKVKFEEPAGDHRVENREARPRRRRHHGAQSLLLCRRPGR